MRAGCKRVAEDGKGQAERLADSNDNDGHSSGGSGSESNPFILTGSAVELDRANGKNRFL